MYLSNGRPHTETLNDFGKAAFNAHYIGSSEEEIITFIKNVISGSDTLKAERYAFMNKYLTIPDTGNASLNIINSILNS